MSRRVKRALGFAALLLGVQAVLAGLYLTLGARDTAPAPALSPVQREVSDFVWHAPDGTDTRLGELRGEPVVLHVWATWCPPCRDELPALLGWAEEAPFRVVAITVDPDWDAVRRFLGGKLPPTVARADAEEVTRAFGTLSLPETWVVDGGGVARARLRGPGDWSSDALRASVRRHAGVP